MHKPFVALLGLMTAEALGAEGFAVRDPVDVVADANAALGVAFEHRIEPGRVTLHCPTCEGEPSVAISFGRQTDGTEQRVRSGETSIARLEQLCQAREPRCRLSALEVAPAIGWISSYPIGSTAGATAVVLRDGDLLTVRSLASDARIARGNLDKIVRSLVPHVVGR